MTSRIQNITTLSSWAKAAALSPAPAAAPAAAPAKKEEAKKCDPKTDKTCKEEKKS